MSIRELVNDVLEGNFEHAGKRLGDWWNDSISPELESLVERLTSDAGKLAEQVARDAYENWQDGDDLPTIARKAFEEAIAKGLDVLEKDIQDWLGLIDRDAAV